MINYQRLTKRLTVVTVSALTLIGCSNQNDEDESVALDTDEQIEWVANFEADSTQGQAMFADIRETFEDGYDALEGEQKASAIDTFVYGVQDQAHRLSSVAAGFMPELQEMMDAYPDVDFETGENHEDLPEGVVRGLLAELDASYARLIRQDGGQFVVGLDRERLEEEFEGYIRPDTLNRMILSSFEREYSLVDYANGHLNFENIWKGLDVIESLDSSTEELALQNEIPRLFYYRALLGYEELSMENGDGTLNEDAIAAMEVLIEEHPNHRRSAHLKRLIDAIREEGVYGEAAHGVANEILEEEFETIYAEMAVELGLEEPETDGEEAPEANGEEAPEANGEEDVDDGE